ncbi:MAG: hypothetical protein JWO19_4499 [Bryobacterales bacterium]|jgi:hypothetical protein|nr:hypothetical protein [Bryobacterales bacterium]
MSQHTDGSIELSKGSPTNSLISIGFFADYVGTERMANPIPKVYDKRGFCQADMDTMTAFCGEYVGSEVVRHDDPAH